MADYYACPTCGEEVLVGSRGCPKCRARKPWFDRFKRKRSKKKKKPEWKPPARHWEQDDVYDDLDLPNDDFDYDKFCAKEFGEGPAHKQIGISWYWWLTGVVLLGWFFYCLGKYWLLIW